MLGGGSRSQISDRSKTERARASTTKSASAAKGGEVSRSGKCVRFVQLGDKEYQVFHAWELCCAKVDWRADDLEGPEFRERKAKCVSGECGECGFGKSGGIPQCSVLDAATDTVKWTHYEDVTTAGGKKYAQQQVEETGTFQELWKECTAHSTTYLVHHSTAKWQRNCHKLCLDTFKDGDVVIESDLIEEHPSREKLL